MPKSKNAKNVNRVKLFFTRWKRDELANCTGEATEKYIRDIESLDLQEFQRKAMEEELVPRLRKVAELLRAGTEEQREEALKFVRAARSV